MGLRLVGLLPCAVWTPKVPKPTIANQARMTTNPYPIVPAASGSASGSVPLSSTRLVNHLEIACRCASSASAQQAQQLSIRSAATSPVATIATQLAPAGVRQIRPSHTAAIRSVVSSASAAGPTTSPMLLVPFAMPGFVPVQGQQPSSHGPPPPPQHVQHLQPSSSLSQQLSHQQITAQAAQQQQSPQQQIQSSISGATIAVTPVSCNNANSKVR